MKKLNNSKGLKFLGILNILLSIIFLIGYYVVIESSMYIFILPFMVLIVFLLVNGVGLFLSHFLLGYILGNLLYIIYLIYSLVALFFETPDLISILIRFIYPLLFLSLLNFRYKKEFSKFSIMKTKSRLFKYTFSTIAIFSSFLLLMPIYNNFQKDPLFLSTIRYKHIDDWVIYKEYYRFQISTVWNADDSKSYEHNIFKETQYQRIAVLWNNDSLKWVKSTIDSVYSYDPKETFFSFDSNIVKIKEDKILPLNEGETILKIKTPLGIDSISLEVYREEDELMFRNNNGLVDGLIRIVTQ